MWNLQKKFGVNYIAIKDKNLNLHLDPNESLNFVDPNSKDQIQVEPRKVFVRYGKKNAIEVDVSNCLTVASFMKEIKKEYPDLKDKEFKLQFNGNDYDANSPLINLLNDIKDYYKDIVEVQIIM